MDVVVIGAGVAGLGTALHLGNAGHAVTLLERDPAPPDDLDEAWDTWERRGVPQARLAHVFLGCMRNAIRDDHPDLYADLLAAGGYEIRYADALPPTIEDRSPRPLDDDLVMLGMRRVALEHHLRRHLAALPTVTIRPESAVDHLTTDTPHAAGIPHVTGVALDDGTTIAADLVVDCSGRRSPLPQWLAAIGAAQAPPEDVTEDGLMYFGRYYRLEPGHAFPAHPGPLTDLGYLFALTFEADQGWFALALAVHSEDKLIRTLRDEDVFEAALQAIPATRCWREPGMSRPMTEVKSMSRIDDRWRDMVVDGTPLVTGFVAVGDSVVATNPAFGRGSSLAWITSRALVDVIGANEHDPVALALAHHDAIVRLVRGWYDQTAQMDAGKLEHMRRLLAGEPEPDPDLNDPSVTFPMGLQLAAQIDPEVFRAFGCIAHILKSPMELLEDSHVTMAAIDAFERREELQAAMAADAGPTRDELLAAMGAVSVG